MSGPAVPSRAAYEDKKPEPALEVVAAGHPSLALFADRERFRCPDLHPVLRIQCERWSGHDGAHRFEVAWVDESEPAA